MLRKCMETVNTIINHQVNIPVCCPVSNNPLTGSYISIFYKPAGIVMPVEDLEVMVNEYINGHENIRNMEEMIQDICLRIKETVKVSVRVKAYLIIQPPFGGEIQKMNMTVRA